MKTNTSHIIRQHPTPLSKVRRQIENVASINIWMEVDPHDGFLLLQEKIKSKLGKNSKFHFVN